MNRKDVSNRLEAIEAEVNRQTINVNTRGVYACMTSLELKELAFGNPSEERVNEIWERAVNEYKSKASKKARGC